MSEKFHQSWRDGLQALLNQVSKASGQYVVFDLKAKDYPFYVDATRLIYIMRLVEGDYTWHLFAGPRPDPTLHIEAIGKIWLVGNTWWHSNDLDQKDFLIIDEFKTQRQFPTFVVGDEWVMKYLGGDQTLELEVKTLTTRMGRPLFAQS